jgi:hypothetical protein
VSVAIRWQLASCYVLHITCKSGASCTIKRKLKSLGHILLPGLLSGYSITSGRLWATLPTVPISHPMISIFGPHNKHLAGKRFTTECDMKPAATSWLQTLDLCFCCAGIQALVPWWDECLNDNGDYVAVWCVPSVTHVPCVYQNQNKVLSTRILVTYFWKALFILDTRNQIGSVDWFGNSWNFHPNTNHLHIPQQRVTFISFKRWSLGKH